MTTAECGGRRASGTSFTTTTTIPTKQVCLLRKMIDLFIHTDTDCTFGYIYWFSMDKSPQSDNLISTFTTVIVWILVKFWILIFAMKVNTIWIWMYSELPQCVPVYFTFMLVHHLLHFSSSLEKITIDSSSVRMCSLKQRVDWLTILKEKRHVRTVFTTVRVVRYIQHANCTNTYVRSFFYWNVQCNESSM